MDKSDIFSVILITHRKSACRFDKVIYRRDVKILGIKDEQFTWPCSGPLPSLETFGMSISSPLLNIYSVNTGREPRNVVRVIRNRFKINIIDYIFCVLTNWYLNGNVVRNRNFCFNFLC